jgi:hypothetical protein
MCERAKGNGECTGKGKREDSATLVYGRWIYYKLKMMTEKTLNILLAITAGLISVLLVSVFVYGLTQLLKLGFLDFLGIQLLVGVFFWGYKHALKLAKEVD